MCILSRQKANQEPARMLKSVEELMRELHGKVRVVDAATALSESRENGGIIIDVREHNEVDIKTAHGTRHVPRGMLEFQLPKLCPDHQHPVYLHCASGGRARLAVEQLLRMGYKNVTAISCSFEEICAVFDAP
jgi:rhodanese-related sulfurtransferase